MLKDCESLRRVSGTGNFASSASIGEYSGSRLSLRVSVATGSRDDMRSAKAHLHLHQIICRQRASFTGQFDLFFQVEGEVVALGAKRTGPCAGSLVGAGCRWDRCQHGVWMIDVRRQSGWAGSADTESKAFWIGIRYGQRTCSAFGVWWR